MKKTFICCSLLFFALIGLSGCSGLGTKNASISVIYGTAAILSLLILICYCLISTKKNVWYLLLFSSVCVVNIGYLALSISQNLHEGLLANRISYFGSVFLPLSMLMITMNILKIQYHKWIPAFLVCIGLFVFAVAASPGYLDIYYKEVTLERVNGVSILSKIYGPWHNLYLFYLMIYFATMLSIISYAATKKGSVPLYYAVILFVAVSLNIGVWLIEQFVKIDFEILSVSYIISEAFLLSLHIVMTENQKLKKQVLEYNRTEEIIVEKLPTPISSAPSSETTDLHKQFLANMTKLTKTEHIIFDFYISGKTTKEILNELCITGNTLKFHNKNIYSKMEVSSRKQLIEIYKQIETKQTSA